MLTIYFRSEFYTNQGIFPLYCKAMTSQQCDQSITMLILGKHYYDDVGMTLTHGYQIHQDIF